MSTGMKKLLISLLFLFFLLQIPRLWKHHPEKELETSVNTTPNLPSSPFLLLLSPPCRPPLAAAPPRSRARRCRTCQRSGPTERCAAPPWPCLPHHLRRFWTAKKPRIPLDSSPQAPPTGRRLQELSSDLSIDGIANPRAASRRDRASRGSQGVAPPCGCGARSTISPGSTQSPSPAGGAHHQASPCPRLGAAGLCSGCPLEEHLWAPHPPASRPPLYIPASSTTEQEDHGKSNRPQRGA
ncbi:hypothetical protein GQ55_3G049600 [Panicum hallii var. hallii]|uniref:Uncharacterized protein n=1 Tax=Panicum hallii var. hallii TaxID=1504633 RepID=A0A2T7E5V7_9POAL|nr:hypothetical protein GQ55_3G049600 [Panicum hallii var. hallii]